MSKTQTEKMRSQIFENLIESRRKTLEFEGGRLKVEKRGTYPLFFFFFPFSRFLSASKGFDEWIGIEQRRLRLGVELGINMEFGVCKKGGYFWRAIGNFEIGLGSTNSLILHPNDVEIHWTSSGMKISLGIFRELDRYLRYSIL